MLDDIQELVEDQSKIVIPTRVLAEDGEAVLARFFVGRVAAAQNPPTGTIKLSYTPHL